MGFGEDMFHKNVVSELTAIRKNFEVLAKVAITLEKAERVNLGLSSISKEFPEYLDTKQKDDTAVSPEEIDSGTCCSG